MSKLAINGGQKAIPEKLDFPKWPIVTEEDKAAINKVIDDRDFWGKESPTVKAFEEEYAEYVGVKYCLALNSGTASLHASVAGAGIGPGDEVIVPAFTFLASATVVLHQNAIPVFVDVDPKTFNIDPSKIEEKITDRTKAIMAVDYQGLPADYDEINAIAEKHNLVVIEDSSQAGGASYNGRKTGSLADIGGMSLMPLKNLPASGEGGILTTDNELFRDLADMVRMFGEVVSAHKEREYNAYTMGWNYRISPICVAMARTQLKRLDRYNHDRAEKAGYISNALAELPGIIPPYVPDDRTHSYYIYYFKVDPKAAGMDIAPGRFRQALQDILRAEGVNVKISQRTPIPGQSLFQVKNGYGKGCPWTCPYGRDVLYRIEDYPIALDVLDRSLAMDVRYFHPLTGESYQKSVINSFQKVFENLDEVVQYARGIEYTAPWENLSKRPAKEYEKAMEYVAEDLDQDFFRSQGNEMR